TGPPRCRSAVPRPSRGARRCCAPGWSSPVAAAALPLARQHALSGARLSPCVENRLDRAGEPGTSEESTVSKRISMAIALAIALPAVFVALSAAPASAHELKKDGAYDLLVGFGNEPAYLGEQNFVQIFVHDLHGNPIESIDTLKVSVEAQGKTMHLAVEPSFDPD